LVESVYGFRDLGFVVSEDLGGEDVFQFDVAVAMKAFDLVAGKDVFIGEKFSA
jgi:hypothetical protein